MLNRKVYGNSCSSGLIIKILLYKMSYFPEQYTLSRNKIKVEIDLSDCATKFYLKGL